MKKRPRLQKLTTAEQSLLTEAQRLFDGGHHAPARQLCERLIRGKPRAPEPLLLKSWINVQEADFFAAQSSVEQAAALLPTDPGVQAWAAEVCSNAGDLRTARAFEKQALRLGDGGSAVLSSLAASFTNAERYADALPYYQRLLELEPGSASNRMNVAYAARFVGDMTLARESLLAVLEDNPQDYQALFALSQLKTAEAGDNHIDWFEKVLAENSEDLQAQSFLGYALGKEYEDIGKFQRSFRGYDMAARSVIRNRRQPSGETEIIDRVRNKFGALPAVEQGDLGQGMIFIVGLPRTGTTLLDRILGAHSRVENGGELRTFPFCAHHRQGLQVRGSMSPELLDKLDAMDFKQIGRAYLDCLPQSLLQAGYLTDKNPINFLYAGLIARALPAAKIVSIRRNPMDSCFSNFKQLFAPGAYMHSYNLQEMAAYFAAYSSLMELWRNSLGERYQEVFYEDLTDDFEREVSAILNACGLDWEEQMAEFFTRRAAVGSASFAQVRQPVYSTSVARWRHFERDLQPLKQALLEQGITESELTS